MRGGIFRLKPEAAFALRRYGEAGCAVEAITLVEEIPLVASAFRRKLIVALGSGTTVSARSSPLCASMTSAKSPGAIDASGRSSVPAVGQIR